MAEDWQARAECNDTGDMMFPVTLREQKILARTVCGAICPVRAECLQYALDTAQVHGVWGGTTERERATLLRLRRVNRDRTPA